MAGRSRDGASIALQVNRKVATELLPRLNAPRELALSKHDFKVTSGMRDFHSQGRLVNKVGIELSDAIEHALLSLHGQLDGNGSLIKVL